MRIPRFWGIHAAPFKAMSWGLAILPFCIMIAGYLVASNLRVQENPDDKLLPAVSKMVNSIERLAFQEDKRTGEYVMLKDTVSSLRRIAIGIGLAAFVGLWFGINLGLFPGFRALFLPFITFLSIVPPLAILPILFITFGVGELAKVMLIFLGTVFVIARDIYLAVRAIPVEQITKALSLGGSQLDVVNRIVLPQVFPRLLDTIRLCLGAAWLFLIASEAIASTDGLGYRIFLVRRYMAMDVIIPYVLWITVIGISFDFMIRRFVSWKFGWYEATRR